MVGGLEQFLLAHIAGAAFGFQGGVQSAAVVVDHLHAKTMRSPAGYGLADTAHADDAQGAAMHLGPGEHVVLVVPYSKESHHTIGAPELELMQPTATLINIARGGIVDDAALAAALRAGRIAAAGLDVFEGEPSVHPALLACSNVVLTPHIASATTATRRAMAMLAVDNLIGYLVHGTAVTPLNDVAKG
jgi:phosphoglycerate dehydrogenase-like enzyme